MAKATSIIFFLICIVLIIVGISLFLQDDEGSKNLPCILVFFGAGGLFFTRIINGELEDGCDIDGGDDIDL